MRAVHRAEDGTMDNQRWFPMFASVSIPTVFLPFTKEQGHAYVVVYRHRYCQGEFPAVEALNELNALSKNIDNAMQHFSSAFIRLSTRSPKDAVRLEKDKFLSKHSHSSLNEKYIQFFQQAVESLCVDTGEDAIELLLSSERIFTDILQSIDADTDEENVYHWDLQLCIRQWESSISDEFEFRGFVVNGDLRGLCQYNPYVYYPSLLQNRDAIKGMIMEFFVRQVQPIIEENTSLSSCVVDFAILCGGRRTSFDASAPVVILELNPLNRRTGAGLFNYDDDEEVFSSNVKQVTSSCIFRVIEEDIYENSSASKQEKGEMFLHIMLDEAQAAFEKSTGDRWIDLITEDPDHGEKYKCFIS